MMNSNDMNIDFLLGLGSTANIGGPTGESEAPENGGLLFGEMLNDMLRSYPGAANRPVINADDQSPSPFGRQLELSSNTEKKGVLAVVSATRPPEMQAANSNGLPTDGVQTVVDDNVAAFNKEIRAQLPADALPKMARAGKINFAVPTNLEAGSYEVIESRQTDGVVTLKLADPSTRDGFIKVELPIERLSSATIGSRTEHPDQPVFVKRVDLDAVPKQTTNVERLFAQLNLKQIVVGNVAADNGSTNDHVAIKLSGANNDGVEFQFKVELSQDQLKALKVEPQQPNAVSSRTANNTSIQKAETVQAGMTRSDGLDDKFLAPRRESPVEPKYAAGQEATETSQPDRTRTAVAQLFAPIPTPKIRSAGHLRSRRVVASGSARSSVASTPQASARADSDQLLTTFGQSLKQSLTAANKIVNNVVRQTTSNFDLSTFGGDSELADPFANLESVRETGKILTGKLSQREVRFSLPDDLASKLKPNGQSVMIRIEPDNLGPARLSLKMYRDRLSARITVETVGIKAVVEQSLDRLTQQLIKAGIDVERIEVALDGRQSGEQLGERHPHWQRQARSAHLDENILTETNEDSPVAPVPVAAPALVGAGGVNVLA